MATRSNKNVTVEENDKGVHREYAQNAPAQETVNARVDILGPFRRPNLAAGLSATALTLGGIDADAPISVLAHSAGQIIGVEYKFSANISAGGASAAIVQPTVAPAGLSPVAQGAATNVASGGTNPQLGVVDLAPVSFAKGDGLGVTVATNGAFAPVTADLDVYLIVRYAASPSVPA